MTAASVVAFGDRAVLVRWEGSGPANRLAAVVSQASADGPLDVSDIVVGSGSVLVHLAPGGAGPDVAVPWLRRVVGGSDPSAAPPGGGPPDGPVLELPVSFDGADLEEVAETAGTDAAGVVGLLTGTELEVSFLGFSPGFPYLVGLPPPLARVDRLATPRTAVPAGSVAVAGGFAAVYPQSTPGGWRLLGRTPVALFDPDRPPYARLAPGDRVRFTVAGAGADTPPSVTTATGVGGAPALPSPRWADVVRPGLLSLVQDGGRMGLAGAGVPGAGPADPDSMTLANRLVGNADDEAAIEATGAGPALRFGVAAHCAVVGAGPGAVTVTVDGHPVPDGAVLPVAAGQVLDVGAVRTGLRAYVAVSGGFDTPVAVGSRSSDLLSGLGPGPLATGDRLGLGPPGRPQGLLAPAPGAPGNGPGVLRILVGPHDLGAPALEHLVAGGWSVDARSNRIGLRLAGTPVPGAGTRTVPSTGMVTGAIQVPPDGNPIILMPDHATVGGYPVIGCVIAADLAALGQLVAGDTVTFTPVDLGTALDLEHRRVRALASRVSGWFPTQAGI